MSSCPYEPWMIAKFLCVENIIFSNVRAPTCTSCLTQNGLTSVWFVWTLSSVLLVLLCIWSWCPVLPSLRLLWVCGGSWGNFNKGQWCLFEPNPSIWSLFWQTRQDENCRLPLLPLCSMCHCGRLSVFRIMGLNYTNDGDLIVHTPSFHFGAI